MKNVRLRILASILGAVIALLPGSASAAEREIFEPGTGKYILVLKDPRVDQDDPVTGTKKAKEPDVAKHGGKVLHKNAGTRIIKLPTRAAGALRREENVAYLQRVWLGESSKEWGDEDNASSIRPESDALLETDDTGLTWTTGQYLYDGSGNIKQIGDDTYRYDAVGRLTEAVVNGVTATYQYDSFGNLVGSTTNGVTRAVPVDASSNRLQGEAYDAAGNLTTQTGAPRYSYDSFSMMDQITKSYSHAQRYIYGPDDERAGTITVGGGGVRRWKIRDFRGKVLREFKAQNNSSLPWEWIEDYVYADGRLLGGDREGYYGGKRHFHSDHLGSVRMVTDQSRMRISVHEYYPFGIEQTDATQEHNRYASITSQPESDARSDPMKFTSHERDWHGWLNVDNDDYLDYMHARYYDPNLGRFLSVDPSRRRDPSAPQSWNRYVYAHNNPLYFVDPDGRDAYPIGPAMQSVVRHGLAHSPEFARMYIRMRDDPRVYWRIRESQTALPGTRAHSDINVVRGGNGAITRVLIFTQVPTPGNNLDVQTGLTGHEGSHGEELLNTGQTLAQRHAAGDATVWPNPAAGPNAFESAFAQTFEQQILQELQSGVAVILPTQSLQDILLPEPTRSLRDVVPPQGGVAQ